MFLKTSFFASVAYIGTQSNILIQLKIPSPRQIFGYGPDWDKWNFTLQIFPVFITLQNVTLTLTLIWYVEYHTISNIGRSLVAPNTNSKNKAKKANNKINKTNNL